MGGPVPPNGPPRLRVGASSIFALTALAALNLFKKSL